MENQVEPLWPRFKTTNDDPAGDAEAHHDAAKTRKGRCAMAACFPARRMDDSGDDGGIPPLETASSGRVAGEESSEETRDF